MKKKNNIPFKERNQQFNWREKQDERAMKIHEKKEYDEFRSLKKQFDISDKDRECEEAYKRLRELSERKNNRKELIMDDCRNQIDVALDIETILIESGLDYQMAYDPESQSYTFILSNFSSDIKN